MWEKKIIYLKVQEINIHKKLTCITLLSIKTKIFSKLKIHIIVRELWPLSFSKAQMAVLQLKGSTCFKRQRISLDTEVYYSW
jgi:hypothetical protein